MKKRSIFIFLFICSMVLYAQVKTSASDQDVPQLKITSRSQETITFIAGYYFDTNADGYIDSIYVKVTTNITGGINNSHVQEIMESNIITLPAFRDFSVSDYSVVTEGFALIVVENTAHEPVTYVTDEDSLAVTQKTLSGGVSVEAATVALYDKVAPIIIHKKVTFNGQDYMSPFIVNFQDTTADTLFIDFSEPVKNISDNVPFYFLNVDSNVHFTANLNLVNSTTTSAEFTIERINSTKITNFHTGDSVWIHDGDRVADVCVDENGNESNNWQNNADNAKQVLTMKDIPVYLDFYPIAVSPLDLNSFDEDSAITIPDVIIQLFSEKELEELNLQTHKNGDYLGMLIQIMPLFGSFDTSIFKGKKLEGTISIFTPTNNAIVSKRKMAFHNKYKTLNWIWNGMNQNGAYVGSGEYFCQIEMKEISLVDNEVKEHKFRLLVGVQGYDDTSSCGSCGTGTEYAFIPPICFNLASILKKRKKWWVSFIKRLKAKIGSIV